MEVYRVTVDCMNVALKEGKKLHPDLALSCIGITNQRETTCVWDKETGLPLHNAIGMSSNLT